MERPRAPEHDGVASCSASHCQLSNCSAGIIEISSTGSDSSALTISRRRSGGGLVGVRPRPRRFGGGRAAW